MIFLSFLVIKSHYRANVQCSKYSTFASNRIIVCGGFVMEFFQCELLRFVPICRQGGSAPAHGVHRHEDQGDPERLLQEQDQDPHLDLLGRFVFGKLKLKVIIICDHRYMCLVGNCMFMLCGSKLQLMHNFCNFVFFSRKMDKTPIHLHPEYVEVKHFL